MLMGLHQPWGAAGAGLSGRARASDLGVGLTAVALALDHDGLDVVQQPVQQCRGQGGVVVEEPAHCLYGRLVVSSVEPRS